jgi:PAS domain S-box-containing protein
MISVAQKDERSLSHKIAITIGIYFVSTVLQWVLWPYIKPAPFLLFYPSVILASAYGNGYLAVALSSFLGQYLFVYNHFDLTMVWPVDYIRQFAFIGSALMIRWVTVRLSLSVKQTRAASQWLTTTLKSIGDCVIATDRDSKIVFMNPMAEKATGWRLADAKGKPLEDVFNIANEITRERVPSPVEKVLELGHSQGLANHTVLIRPDGSEIVIEDSAAPIRGDQAGILGVVLVFRDSTESKKAQRKIKESEELFRSFFSTASVGFVLANPVSGKFLRANAKMEELTGYSHKELLELDVRSITHPDDREKDWQEFQELVKKRSGAKVSEKRYLRKDGKPIWVLTNSVLQHDEFSNPVMVLGVVQDISSLKEVEQRLRDALKARDEFLSIASHELKTPVTSLKLQAQIRLRELKRQETKALDPERVKSDLELDLRQVERLSRLIDDMLDISRISSGKLQMQKETFDLCQEVAEVIERLRPQFEVFQSDIRIEHCGSVVGSWDKFRIEQVVLNLLINALKYGAGKPVHVEIAKVDGHGVLSVQDEGVGIPQADISRIFERFERAHTQSDSGGLGLGLFISRQIVEMHGGHISVDSQPGKGSTFKVALPIEKKPD